VPVLYVWIIALAGWIVPRAERTQWRRERETALAGTGSTVGRGGPSTQICLVWR